MARIIRSFARVPGGYNLQVERENAYVNGESDTAVVFVSAAPDSDVEEVLDAARVQLDAPIDLRGQEIPDTASFSEHDVRVFHERWWMGKTTVDELHERYPTPGPQIAAAIAKVEARTDVLWSRYEQALLAYHQAH